LREVRSGKPLADAFERSGRTLPAYFVSMIAAGEAGGSLPSTLRRLEELQRKQIEVRERVRGALVYPSLLAGMVIVTLVVLLAFVLPRFELLFAESRATLPWSTRAVLGVGRAVADYWAVGISVIAVAVVGFFWWFRSTPGREAFDRWLLRTRLTFGIPGAINTGRLFRTVSTLCSNGQPLPAALRIARGTVTNRHLARALEAVIRDVQAGRALSDALSGTKAFPAVAVQLTRVGEETGHLDDMLASVAAVLEESSHSSLERLLTLLVPVLTVAMGLIVAALIGSVLVGLLSINDLAF
jgi:general secretion pathway protein F